MRSGSLLVCLLSPILLIGPASLGAQESRRSVGSGQSHRSEVTRTVEKPMPPEDAPQASLLASCLVLHVDRAASYLREGQPQFVRPELQQALTLVTLLREILPVVAVTTVVTNPRGEEVYRSLDRGQEDLVPFSGRTGVAGPLDPIVDPASEATFVGTRLRDAADSSGLLDLTWVEARVRRASDLLENNREGALAYLVLAQAGGIRPVGTTDVDALVEAGIALGLAERLLAERRYEAARMNLRAALARVGVHGARSGQARSTGLRELEEEIARAVALADRDGTPERIQAASRRVMDLIEASTSKTRGAGGAPERK